MDLDIYKEQLVETFNTYRSRVEDNSSYIQLKEKYDNLPQNGQKAIVYGVLFLIVYFVYSIPASFVTSADEKLEFFEENRQLTRELIRAGRIEKTVQLPPPAPSTQSLQSQVEAKLSQERVTPEQKLNSQPIKNVAATSIVPKSIIQNGVKTTIKQLNLKQVVKLGESFDDISGTQLMNIAIQADNKDPHYFNVDYEVASFSVPIEKEASPKKSSKKSSRYKKRK